MIRTVYTESQSLTIFILASTIPICPLGYVGMVVKAYLTTGKRDRHPVIIFLMRGRSLHWHSPVTMVTVIQCSICTGISCSTIPDDILTTLTSPFDSYPENRWFLLVVEQLSSSQNMASQTDTWQDLWKDTTIVAILVRWFIIRGWAWVSMHNLLMFCHGTQILNNMSAVPWAW